MIVAVCWNLSSVLMAKLPEPGRVKTRLADQSGRFSEQQAAFIAGAMLRCTAQRLLDRGRLWIAISPDDAGAALLERHLADLPIEPERVVPQGTGNLGERMLRIWQRIYLEGSREQGAGNRAEDDVRRPTPNIESGSGTPALRAGTHDAERRATSQRNPESPNANCQFPISNCPPIAFFGMDCPDVPDHALDAIPQQLQQYDAVIGPTTDGGYWTLAANRPLPALLEKIDWGTPIVYDQTVARARAHGIALGTLPTWQDVDSPDNVAHLRKRLSQLELATGPGPDQPGELTADDDPLLELQQQLGSIW